MDKERAMLAGSLARAALELGHPKVRTFGIDPHKKVWPLSAPPWWIYVTLMVHGVLFCLFFLMGENWHKTNIGMRKAGENHGNPR